MNQQQITYNLWFDHEAEEAVKFYTGIFPASSTGAVTHYGKEGYEIHKQPEGKVMTVSFHLSGSDFIALNGGPDFRINPSISFFVLCTSEEETNRIWNALREDGNILMPLDKYPWSDRYGWVQDRFGVCWEIALGKMEDTGQKITPTMLFTNKQHGNAEAAIRFYTSVFSNSGITGILKYDAGEQEPEGTVKHAMFRLCGQGFMAMDSSLPHQFTFNEGVSLIINCDTQEEVDHYWHKLSAGGEEGPCGWLKDRFGVSWQVVPVQLQQMLEQGDKARREQVTKAFLHMKKLDIAALEAAYNK